MATASLHAPITKGGFSNDGADVMTRSLPVRDPGQATASVPLSSSGLSLKAYYEIDRIVEFVWRNKSLRVALQFPDDLVSDAPALVFALNAELDAAQRREPRDDVIAMPGGRVALYVLGDTSYGSCCVDEVAGQHVNADAIVHFGFACLTPSTRVPTLFVFGARSVDVDAAAAALTDPAQLAAVFPSSASPDKGATAARAAAVVGAGKSVLVLYDRQLHGVMPALASALQARGANVVLTPAAAAGARGAGEQAPVKVKVPTGPRFVIAASTTDNALWRKGLDFESNAPAAGSCGEVASSSSSSASPSVEDVSPSAEGSRSPIAAAAAAGSGVSAFEFAGFTWRGSSESAGDVPDKKDGDVNNPDVDGDVDGEGDGGDEDPSVPAGAALTKWSRAFAPARWAIVVLSTRELKAAGGGDVASPTSIVAATSSSKPSTGVFGASTAAAGTLGGSAGAISATSQALVAHTVLNFRNHVVATLACVDLPSSSRPSSNSSSSSSSSAASGGSAALSPSSPASPASLPSLEVCSGRANFTRLMGRRYYLTEKAKNCSIFGIVVCTLVTSRTMEAINRAQALLRAAQRKSYLLSVGKINEPKLLNFPEVEMFVVIGCPLSALVETPTTSSAALITAVELEFAFDTARAWSGQYSTDFRDMLPDTGRLGFATAGSSSSSSSSGGAAGSGASDCSAVAGGKGRCGGGGGCGSALAAGSGAAGACCDSAGACASSGSCCRNLNADDVDDDEGEQAEEDEEPRFSAIDGKLHARIARDAVRGAVTAAPVSDTRLIESTTGGALIEDVGYKPYVRTFTGLDGALAPEDKAMHIQPGVHGTARHYVPYHGRWGAQATTADAGAGPAAGAAASADSTASASGSDTSPS